MPDGQFPHVTFPWPNIMLVFILKIELDQTTEIKIQYEDKSHNLVDYICRITKDIQITANFTLTCFRTLALLLKMIL